MLFEEYKINDFLTELSSEAPSPGGGSTAALVSALSGGLNSMVYSLTVDKKSYEYLNEEDKNKMIILQKEARNFIEVSKEFMERDRKDFLELMNSYKMPKNTEEEIRNRKEKIKENTIKAMETPLSLAEECIRFYENIEFAVKFGNRNLISDAGVAATLLHSAIESAIINVKVNLNSLRSEDFSMEIEEKCNNLLNESSIKKSNLMNEVNNIIYPKKSL